MTHRSAGDGSIPIGALVRVDLIGLVESGRNAAVSRGISCFHRRDDHEAVSLSAAGSLGHGCARLAPRTGFHAGPDTRTGWLQDMGHARRATRNDRAYARARRRRMGRHDAEPAIDSRMPMMAHPAVRSSPRKGKHDLA